MRTGYVYSALALAATAMAAPQGVTSAIAPSAPVPSGCSTSYSGKFQITVVNVTTAAKTKRDALELTLSSGVLKDAQQRTGYVASNYQFQFDGPPQAGAIYTSGFSVCGNGSLALGGSAIWYQCYSGGFYNLYDRHWAAQCSPIYINVIGAGSSVPKVTVASDGQPAVTTAVTTAVTQITDGQVQATTKAVSQISDGQVQAVSQIADGQIQGPGVISQIADGQPQAPKASATAAKVSQISDGQIQVTSAAAAVSQRTDGQVIATSAAASAKVSQISDGQIQAPSATAGAVVSQISDGQVQASKAATPVTQIGDGQIQAVASANTTRSAPAQVTVNAASRQGEGIAAIAGLAAAFALL